MGWGLFHLSDGHHGYVCALVQQIRGVSLDVAAREGHYGRFALNMRDETKPLSKVFLFVYGALAATLYVVAGWRFFKNSEKGCAPSRVGARDVPPLALLAADKDTDEGASAALFTAQETDSAVCEVPGPPAPSGIVLPLGWQMPRPKKLPQPTYWPAVLAFATVLFAWGWVTDVYISVIGFVLFGIALGGWIGDLRHEVNT